MRRYAGPLLPPLTALSLCADCGGTQRRTHAHRRTLLHEAAAGGHAATIAWLLARGADPDVRDLGRWRATALELAVLNGCYAAVLALR